MAEVYTNAEYEYDYDPKVEYDDEQYDDYIDGDEDGLYDSFDDSVAVPMPAPVRWTQIRVNDETLMVSSAGRVKPFGSENMFTLSSAGTRFPGTPYSFVVVGNKKYFMHDLVWLAFNGPIPHGYEIRHVDHYVQKNPHKMYSNNIECLCVQPVTITKINSLSHL
jgi:hypothetical protein